MLKLELNHIKGTKPNIKCKAKRHAWRTEQAEEQNDSVLINKVMCLACEVIYFQINYISDPPVKHLMVQLYFR